MCIERADHTSSYIWVYFWQCNNNHHENKPQIFAVAICIDSSCIGKKHFKNTLLEGI